MLATLQGFLRGGVGQKDCMPRKRTNTAPGFAEPLFPEGNIAELREQAAGCRACDLWKPATQTVFGEGPDNARIMFIGEQPGSVEDLEGRPFVGPAGRMFDKAMAEAGIDRSRVYVTNTVKHFRFERRGKLRLHKRANPAQQAACRPWLAAEIARIQPKFIVCLGAMASAAMFGPTFSVLRERGQWRELGEGVRAFATIHPSALLRITEEFDRKVAYDEFVSDLRLLAKAR